MSVVSRLTVRGKIFLVMASVTALLIAAEAAYFWRQEAQSLRSSLEARASSVARVLAVQLKAPLDFNDRDAAQKMLASAAGDVDLRYARLHGADGTIIAAHGQQHDGKTRAAWVDQVSVAWGPDAVDVRAPVVGDDGARGVVSLALSTKSIDAQMSASLAGLALAGFLAVAIAFIAAYLLGRSIGARLEVIAAVTGKVARGDLSQAAIRDDSADEIGGMTASLNVMLDALSKLTQRVGRVADGDLSTTSELSGHLPDAVNRMIVAQRAMVRQIVETALQVNSSAEQFVANARQQEGGASEQSAAVEETRHTMESLLGSARDIGRTSQSVLEIAERTQQNSQLVAQRITALSKHTERIGEILEIIKDIANKSDLLALNAAIEGTKAGEAGRGFSLVANQMQRLAENVMGSVRDIKDLTSTINDATEASVLAVEETTKLASETARATKQIALIIQQQQTSTEQVTKAMNDVALVAGQTAQGSKESVTSASDLLKVAEELRELVGRYRLGEQQHALLHPSTLPPSSPSPSPPLPPSSSPPPHSHQAAAE